MRLRCCIPRFRSESGTTASKIQSGRARVVIGTRSAVFAPVKDLGILIIDEEQDGGVPVRAVPALPRAGRSKYRAAQENALLVFGSATPVGRDLLRLPAGKYPVFTLSERFLGAGLPDVLIADMARLAREGREGMIGPQLESELIGALGRGKQAILFLNRRGNSRVIGCAICGWVPECPSCSTSMTYHSASGRAMCHYCGASVRITGRCPACGEESLFKTPGTQKVEQELQVKFPAARVLRMDPDTYAPRAHMNAACAVRQGRGGYPARHPDGDQGLDFETSRWSACWTRTRACMRRIIARVSARFRSSRRWWGARDGGSIPERRSFRLAAPHPVIPAAARQDYEAFFERELETRGALRCPPVCDLTVLTAAGEVEQQVLKSLPRPQGPPAKPDGRAVRDVKAPVLGPAAAQVVRVMGRYRYHLTMRARNTARWRSLIAGVLREFLLDSKNRGVTVFADENPDL